jgi:hypothetical protein
MTDRLTDKRTESKAFCTSCATDFKDLRFAKTWVNKKKVLFFIVNIFKSIN